MHVEEAPASETYMVWTPGVLVAEPSSGMQVCGAAVERLPIVFLNPRYPGAVLFDPAFLIAQ